VEVFVPEKPQHETESKPEKQFDKIWTAFENSNTRELLRKGKVRLRSQTNYSTYDYEEHEHQRRRALSADCVPSDNLFRKNNDPCSPASSIRTVIGCDNSDSGLDSTQLSPQYHTKDGSEEGTGNEGYRIDRKQRKSKRDKKTKIEKVEKTFFV
jgi:hypothetical protein